MDTSFFFNVIAIVFNKLLMIFVAISLFIPFFTDDDQNDTESLKSNSDCGE